MSVYLCSIKGSFGALVQVTVLAVNAESITEQQVVVGAPVANFHDVHMNVTGSGSHRAMAPIANSKFVANIPAIWSM